MPNHGVGHCGNEGVRTKCSRPSFVEEQMLWSIDDISLPIRRHEDIVV